MRLSFASTLLTLLSYFSFASAINVIESNSLNPCMTNSSFTANLFSVSLTPSNKSATLQVQGVSTIEGYVTAQVSLIAYGFTIVNTTVNPCDHNLQGFCPMAKSSTLTLDTNFDIPQSTLNNIPGVAYYVPDLDGIIQVKVYQNGSTTELACLEMELSNTKSVYQPAVGWVTAIIAGMGLLASGITSGMGHTNTAAHVAANAVSLFGVFQAQAVIGMTSVEMPPIVQSWTQNFQWSMGIIRVGFLQDLATWYQRATGGTPTTYLSTLSTKSVEVQKRMVKRAARLMARAVTESLAPRGAAVIRSLTNLAKRSTAGSTSDVSSQTVIVRGIERVGFRANIEETNIFLTGLIFFLCVLLIVALLVALAKVVFEGCVRAGWMQSDRFLEFRNGWKIVIKGILFRLVLLGYVQMSILCLWELTERDSAAEVVLAVFVFLSVTACLAFAAFKVFMLAKRSVTMHKNPAYILYSDPACLNKWGFLYISYKATSYYFVSVVLAYVLLKSVFIAFAQSAPVVQAVGLLIIEAVFLIIVSVLRPWMDKKTNAFNIAISAINFVNTIFLLIFSNCFGQPPEVSGIMGVLFALYNLIFMAVLLIMVLIASIYAVTSKNPETRYQPMRDDRGSFIKSQAALTTELDALGATARGDSKEAYEEHYAPPKDMDDSSLSSESLNRAAPPSSRPISQALRPSEPAKYPGEAQPMYQQPNMSHSQSNNFSRPGPPPSANGPGGYGYGNGNGNGNGYGGYSPASAGGYRPQPSPRAQPPPRQAPGGYGPQQFRSNTSSPSPWQRGAGYD